MGSSDFTHTKKINRERWTTTTLSQWSWYKFKSIELQVWKSTYQFGVRYEKHVNTLHSKDVNTSSEYGHKKIISVFCVQNKDRIISKSTKREFSRDIHGLVQERRNSSALAMELRLSCTNPSIYLHLALIKVLRTNKYIHQNINLTATFKIIILTTKVHWISAFPTSSYIVLKLKGCWGLIEIKTNYEEIFITWRPR